MLDFRNETTRTRLNKAIQSSYRTLEPFRKLTQSLIKEYAGPGYGNNNAEKEQYLNLMNQVVRAYTMAIVANRPRVMVSTQQPTLTAFAKHFETATNNLCTEIKLKKTLRKWLVDAIFCVGIVKVHLADSAEVMIENDVWMDPGIPYASNISIDDWVHDTQAKTLGHCKFFGDMFRVPFEAVRNGQYDEEATRDLKPNSKFAQTDVERIDRIAKGYETDDDELEPMIDLCEIYIPRDRMLYTFAVDSRQNFTIKGPPLASVEWTGSERGPYHFLGFTDVPENIMPASIADQLSGLSRLINNLMRKQSGQARRQQDINVFTPAGADDAKKLKRAVDGEWVSVQDTDSVAVIKRGGVDPNNQQFMLNSLELFDRMAGNLTAMLGLGKQAGTVGQEQLIHSAASRQESEMQERFVDAVTDLAKDLGMLLWEDEFKTIPAQMQIPGTDFQVDATWNPLDREGSFLDYNFAIDIYSMSPQTPSQRMQGIMQIVTQVFSPMAPFLQAQGGTIDMAKLASIFSEMMSEPKLLEILKFDQPIPSELPAPEGPRKPPTSSREYIRRNVSEGNNSNDSMASEWSTAGAE